MNLYKPEIDGLEDDFPAFFWGGPKTSQVKQPLNLRGQLPRGSTQPVGRVGFKLGQIITTKPPSSHLKLWFSK